MGHTASFSSSLSGRSRWLSRRPFKPFVSTETLKACALIGLHLLAAEGEAGSSDSQSPDLGGMLRYGCPESPDWDSESRRLKANALLHVSCANTMSKALLFMPSGKIGQAKSLSLPGRLGTCEGGFFAATLPWICCARKCMRPGGRVAASKTPAVTA